MRIISLLALAFTAACNGPDADSEVEADTDTDSDADTDTDTDTDADTDTEDTDTDLPPTSLWAVPPGMDAAMGGTGMDFGVHTRAMMQVPASMMPDEPVEIVELRLRRATGSADQTATTSLPQVELWLGTGTAAPGTEISNTFADNLSGDERAVFSGPLSIAANAGDTLLFDDWVVAVDPPFAFDAAEGPLMFDLRMTSTGANVLFDCKNDGTVQIRLSTTPGAVEASNGGGCGYALELVVR